MQGTKQVQRQQEVPCSIDAGPAPSPQWGRAASTHIVTLATRWFAGPRQPACIIEPREGDRAVDAP
jgi:hypothetical protein